MAEDFDFATEMQPTFDAAVTAGKSGLASLAGDQQRNRQMEGSRLAGGLSTLQNWDANHQNVALMKGAAGMLAPTKTGSFSESMSNALGQGASGLQWQQQQEMDRVEKIQRLQQAQSALALRPSGDALDRAGKGFGFMDAAEKAYTPIQNAGFDKWFSRMTTPQGDPLTDLTGGGGGGGYNPVGNDGFVIPGTPSAAASPAPASVAPAATADASATPAPEPAVAAPAPVQTADAGMDPDLPAPNSAEAQAANGQRQPSIPALPDNLKPYQTINPMLERDWQMLNLAKQFPEKFANGRGAEEKKAAITRMQEFQKALLAKEKKDGPEDVGAKELAKGQAENFNELAKGYGAARQSQGQVQQLEDLMQRVPSGPTGWFAAQAARMGWGEHANDIQAMNSLLERMVPAQRQGLPGAASDRDVAMFRAALPSMYQTEQGRQTIVNTMKSIQEYEARRSQIGLQVQRGDLTTRQGSELLEKMPDPFTIYKAYEDKSRAAASDKAKTEKENTGKGRAEKAKAAARGEAPEGAVATDGNGNAIIKRNGKWEAY